MLERQVSHLKEILERLDEKIDLVAINVDSSENLFGVSVHEMMTGNSASRQIFELSRFTLNQAQKIQWQTLRTEKNTELGRKQFLFV